MDLKKRERAANFNAAEVQVLIKVVEKYKHIVENKKTDTTTNRDKEAAWGKIANSFNASGISPSSRSWKTLKLKYEGLKKSTKKKASQQRQELYRTGGGPPNAPEFSDVEEKVLSICSNINGLPSRYDCDNIEIPSDNTQKEIIVTFTDNEEPTLDITEDCIIQEATSNSSVLAHDNDHPVIIAISKDESVYSHIKETNQKSKLDLNQSAFKTDEVFQAEKENKWERWHPTALKSSVSKVLKEKVTKGSVTTKLDQLSTARLELVSLQKEIAKKEHKFKEEEHLLLMEHMKNEDRRKEEIHNLLISKMKNAN